MGCVRPGAAGVARRHAEPRHAVAGLRPRLIPAFGARTELLAVPLTAEAQEGGRVTDD